MKLFAVGLHACIPCVTAPVPGDLVLVESSSKRTPTRGVRVLGCEGAMGRVVAVTPAGAAAGAGVCDVQFFEPRSCRAFVLRVHSDRLLVARTMFGHVYCKRVPVDVRHMLTKASDALGITAARRCIVSLLLSWPEDVRFTKTTMGGSASLLQLSKLIIASECRGWDRGAR